MSFFFGKTKEAWANGAGPDFIGDNIKCALIDTGVWTPDESTDEFLSDAAGAIVSTSANLTGKTNVLGVLDADDTLFPGTAAGTICSGFIVYQDTGVAGTSRLLAFINVAASGLPVTTDGSDITCTFQATAPFLGEI